MKVNNTKRLTITLSTLCLASTLFCSANAHTALKKGCYDASIAYPLGAEMTMVGTPMVCTYAVLPNGKTGYHWEPLHSAVHKVALTKPLKVNGTHLSAGAHFGATLDADNNVSAYIHSMHAKINALNSARNNLADTVRYSSKENVRLVKEIMQNSPLYEFKVGVQTVSPKLSQVLNSTLAFYQRQRTNILLAALVAQQKRYLHREHLVNQLRAYLRHLSKDSSHQAVRQLVMAGQQAANVYDDVTLLRHGLPNATFTQIKYWDPSVTIKRDGRSIHINPLDHTQFNQEVLFFNGDNDWQVAFARMLVKRSQLPVVLVATQGNIKQLVHTLDAPVYFAHQKTIARLGIHAVPTVVTRGFGYNANRLVFKTVKLPYHFLNQKVYEFTNNAFHSNDALFTAANHAMANQHNNEDKTPVTASLLTRLRDSADADMNNMQSNDAVLSVGSGAITPAFSIDDFDKNLHAVAQAMHDEATGLSASKKTGNVSTYACNGGVTVFPGDFNISEKQLIKIAKDALSESSNIFPTKTNSNVNHDEALGGYYWDGKPTHEIHIHVPAPSYSAGNGGIDLYAVQQKAGQTA